MGVLHIRTAYAFNDTARSTTQGIVQDSEETINFCGTYTNGSCQATGSCSTTVRFTPPGQSTSFTITDSLCGALAKGTLVEVRYDPNNPSIAKTSRQASIDTSLGRDFLLIIAISGLIFFVWRIYKFQKEG
jgi:hypothetical protein